MEAEKDALRRDKDDKEVEVKRIRMRYANIVGVE